MAYLYRGISTIDDENNDGQLLPKGLREHVEGQCGELWVQCGEGVECGSSDNNAVIAHQSDSDKSNTSYISTSKSREVAIKFATCGNLVDGYIYTLDPQKFDEHGVIAYEREIGSVANEAEITIRSKNGGPIPSQVVVSKQLVKPI